MVERRRKWVERHARCGKLSWFVMRSNGEYQLKDPAFCEIVSICFHVFILQVVCALVEMYVRVSFRTVLTIRE
jgi:hypothetical protein